MNTLPLISHRMFAAALGRRANAAQNAGRRSSVTAEAHHHFDPHHDKNRNNAPVLPVTAPQRLLASVGLGGI